MSLAIKRFKVYVQLFLLVALAGAIAVVVFKNRNNEAQIWFFGLTGEQPINVLWLLAWTASATLLIAKIVWFMRGLLRDVREVKNMEMATAAAKEQLRREAELAERERVVNEKLRANRDRKTDGDQDQV